MIRVRVVERVQVPATVGREGRDRVGAGDQQLPQLLGRVRRRPGTGRPSRRSRSARRRPARPTAGRRRRGSSRRRADRAGTRPAARRRIVEDQRRRQPQPGRGGQPVAQLHRGQRVEARAPGTRGRVPPRRRTECPSTAAAWSRTTVEDRPARLGGRQARQPYGQRQPTGHRSAATGVAAARASRREADAARPRGQRGGEPLPVDVGDN